MLFLETVYNSLPFFVAPFILALFSFISAYVLKFGVRGTGIHADYIMFTFYVVLACLLGGVL